MPISVLFLLLPLCLSSLLPFLEFRGLKRPIITDLWVFRKPEISTSFLDNGSYENDTKRTLGCCTVIGGSLSQCNLGVLTSVLGCFVHGFRFRILTRKLRQLLSPLSSMFFFCKCFGSVPSVTVMLVQGVLPMAACPGQAKPLSCLFILVLLLL